MREGSYRDWRLREVGGGGLTVVEFRGDCEARIRGTGGGSGAGREQIAGN